MAAQNPSVLGNSTSRRAPSALKGESFLREALEKAVLTPAHAEQILRLPDSMLRQQVFTSVCEKRLTVVATRELVTRTLLLQQEAQALGGLSPIYRGNFNYSFETPHPDRWYSVLQVLWRQVRKKLKPASAEWSYKTTSQENLPIKISLAHSAASGENHPQNRS